jgi:acetylornithine deacetylase/succinyl-diaminopimelate desuccinylase-like protein
MQPLSTIISNTTAEALLHDLVAIPSPSHEEANAVNHLVGWMRDSGYTQAFRDEAGNAVGIIGEGNGSRDIVLLGHIDTFPPAYLQSTSTDGRCTVVAVSMPRARCVHLPSPLSTSEMP